MNEYKCLLISAENKEINTSNEITYFSEVFYPAVQLITVNAQLDPDLVSPVGGGVVRVVVMGLGRLWVPAGQLVCVLTENRGIVDKRTAIVPEGWTCIG